MKYEWKKIEKDYYLPKIQPQFITIPKYKFFTITGKGNPNDAFFADYVSALYALSYAIKMSPKKGLTPEGYFDYSIYPLEGVWDITEEARNSFNGTINKNDLVFTLMIRQPDFVENDFAAAIIENLKKKKSHSLIEHVQFEEITEGPCIQMLHIGSYDNEPLSFEIMENYCKEAQYKRISKIHREIYLSDARKTATEKLKTVLRFKVASK